MSSKKSSKTVKLVKLLANLGYGSRREVTRMVENGWVTDETGEACSPDAVLDLADGAAYAALRVDDEPLDPPPGMLLMLNKPAGYTCSAKDVGTLVYDLLPSRFRLRDPQLSMVGRLDRETSGLLLMTDDGPLLHRIISPKSQVGKVYEVFLADDLRGDEVALFAAGTLMLEGEDTPLAPAELVPLEERRVFVTLHEGRYHQVRRMFSAVGNHVKDLRRVQIGGLSLGDLPEGEWRLLDAAHTARIFSAGGAEGR